MAWKIQPQRSSSTALLHRGGCATYLDQVGLISREDAMVALAQPDIEPCEVCQAADRTSELTPPYAAAYECVRPPAPPRDLLR